MHDPDTHASGMTLRDYFAAKVIPEFLELCGSYATAAKEAYAVADAMLAAREQPPPPSTRGNPGASSEALLFFK
jgi:hypothetical protein